MPLAGEYFVNPSFNAFTAASLICCGVSKSGSPAPKPTTSCPSAFICLAFESIARVSDGDNVAARREILYFISEETDSLSVPTGQAPVHKKFVLELCGYGLSCKWPEFR